MNAIPWRTRVRPAIVAAVLWLAPDSPAADLRLYFIGNSLSRGLTLASGQDRARLEGLFAARGDRLVFGTQLGAGVNLDEHWCKRRLSTGAALQLTHMDDVGETSVSDGSTYAFSFFRDYQFAFQGGQRDADGTILTGRRFDGIVLQPYQSLLEQSHYVAADQAKGFRGDRAAIRDFIGYATGDGVTAPPNDPPYSLGNPNTHRAASRFYVYSAWPRLEGIEGKAYDPDGDGVASFSEFYSAPYAVPAGGVLAQNISKTVPNRDFVAQLIAAARADHPGETIHLIPVGEVFAAVDDLIRAGQLPGIEAYFTRNAAYYLDARLDGKATLAEAGFTYPYGPGFVAAHGVKNFYCDQVHMNDQTHNDERSGTIGAYLAAATVHAVITGQDPGRLTPAEVAALYEKFDATADAALITKLQETVWSVVTTDPRTGVVMVPAAATSYADFKSARFTPSQQADAQIVAEGADPDADGLLNIVEFFFLTDPLAATPGRSLALAIDGGQTEVTFRALSRVPRLHPRLEASADLVQWTRTKLGDLRSAPFGDTGLSDYAGTFSATGSRQFYRLAFSFVPDGPTEPLVAWGAGAGIVAADINLVRGNGSSAVDLSSPANPAVGASYTTASPVFYAAAQALVANNTVSAYRVDNDPDGLADTLQVGFSRGTASEVRGVFTAIWRQDGDGSAHGFLHGAHAGAVALASLRLRARINSATTGVTQTRFIVQEGGQWFISDDCGAVTGITRFDTIRLDDPHGVAWFAFDPASHAVIGAEVPAPALRQVTAVGFQWRCFATGTTQTLSIESFEARFVPE